jgi:hypothetical protein
MFDLEKLKHDCAIIKIKQLIAEFESDEDYESANKLEEIGKERGYLE